MAAIFAPPPAGRQPSSTVKELYYEARAWAGLDSGELAKELADIASVLEKRGGKVNDGE